MSAGAPAAGVASRVLSALHTSDPLYAVLDGARDPRIAAFVGWDKPAWCLYRGELPRKLAMAAPWLLRLARGHGYVDTLFEQSWGRAWGVLVASRAPSRDLRRHLRRFLRVRTEDARTLVFRWYDPRVLRVFLPTCTADQVAALFGPLSALAAEGETADELLVFRPCANGLHRSSIRLTAAASAPAAAVPAPPPPPSRHPRFVIRTAQLRALQELRDAAWAEQTCRALRTRLPATVESVPDAEVRARCLEALGRATTYGLRGDDLLKFVVMTFTVARAFDRRPAFQQILADPALAGTTKLATLQQRVPAAEWVAAQEGRTA